MKKLALLTISLLISGHFFAQSLETFVPISSEIVFTFDLKKITEKIGKEKILGSETFNKITRELILNKNPEVRISEIGINLEREMQIFYNITDKMEYFGILYGIENESKFDSYIRENNANGSVETQGEYKILFFNNNDELIAWNKDHAVYLKIEYLNSEIKPLTTRSDSYWFREYPELNPEPNSFKNSSSYHREYYEYTCEEGVEYVEGVSCEEGTCEDGDSYEIEFGSIPKVLVEYEEVEEAAKPEIVPFTEEELNAMKIKLDKIKADYDKKREIRLNELKSAFISELSTYFTPNIEKSILSDKNYTSGKNSESDIYVWIKQNPSYLGYGISDVFRPRRRYYRDMLSNLNYMMGDQIYANVFFKKDKISLISNINYGSKVSSLYSEIYDTKFSKKLLKQVKAEQVLWISTISLNAERLWFHYPSIYANLLESYLTRDEAFSEEIALIVEFCQIAIDEKALSDLATGDMLFVLKGFREMEVKYNTYEYNEDYSERTKVERTRMDILPQFSGLFATNNEDFLSRILNLGVKHNVLIRTNDYYETNVDSRDFPFKIGFAINKGIAMVSSDVYEVKEFSEGKLKGSLSKETISKVTKNQAYNLFDIHSFMTEMPYQGFDGKELSNYEYIRDNTRTIELFSNFKDEMFETTLDIAIPEKEKNGADYLWNFINEMYIRSQED